jgi:hypothetical protein
MVSKNAQWAFIFDTLGKEDLRELLMRAAIEKDENGRVVIEFDGENAMDVTEHYSTMEKELDT